MKNFFCLFKLPHLYSYTTNFKLTDEIFYKSVKTLTLWAGFFSGVGFRLSVAFNIGLCVDVVMTLRFPFASRDKRMRMTIILSLCFCLLSPFANGIIGNDFTYHAAVVLTLIIAMPVYGVIAIGSIIYVVIKLQEPHMSKELQKILLWRHSL